MNDAAELFWMLARTTLWLSLAGLATAAVLRLARANWPAAHRLGWTLTLLVGWSFLRVPIAIPWYEAPIVPADVVVESLIEPLAEPLAEPVPLDLMTVDTVVAGPVSPSPPEVFASPPQVVVSAAPRSSWHQWSWPDWPLAAVGLWMLGIVAIPAIWLVGYARFVRLLPRSGEVDPAWQDQWDDLLSAAGVRRRIPLRITLNLGPMLCRLPRGYELLVPEALWCELDAPQRRAILRHELAHYLRGDVWKSLAVRLLALPHWFNPMAWYAVRRFDEAAEWACDRAATADLPATTYAKALLRLGCTLSETPVYGSAARGRVLAARIRRLLKGQQKEDSTMKKTVLITCGLVLVGLAVVRLELVAKEPATVGELGPAEQSRKDGDAIGRLQPVEREEDSELKVDILQVPTAEQAQKMVEEARKAYEAHMVAYEAETVPLESVYGWSLRWMQSAQLAAKDPGQRLDAAEAHLDRMQNLQKKISVLYEEGKKGGEATNDRAAKYYVAEAERRRAEAVAAWPKVLDIRDVVKDGKNVATIAGADRIAGIKKLKAALEQAEAQLQALERELENVKLSADQRKRLEADKLKFQAQRESLRKQLSQQTSQPRAVAADLGARNTVSKADLIDLKIKIAELDGQLKQTEAQLEVAKAVVDRYTQANKSVPGSVAESELRRYKADVDKLEAVRRALPEQLKLYKEKLKLYEQAVSDLVPKTPAAKASATAFPAEPTVGPQDAPSKAPARAEAPAVGPADSNLSEVLPRSTVGRLVAPQPEPGGQRARDERKRSLRYAGKDFDAWVEELNDLNPQRQAEAISALGAFGANGYGPEAAAKILETMRGATMWLGDPAAEHVKAVGIEAFKLIPTQDSWPLVKQALKSQRANERMFAILILFYFPPEETLPPLREMVDDRSERVRAVAANALMNADPTDPKLVDALRGLLASKKDDMVNWGLTLVYPGRTKAGPQTGLQKRLPEETLVAIAPELIKLLARGSHIEQTATQTLVNIGAPAIPALEKAHQTGPPGEQAKTGNILDRIQAVRKQDGAPKSSE